MLRRPRQAKRLRRPRLARRAKRLRRTPGPRRTRPTPPGAHRIRDPGFAPIPQRPADRAVTRDLDGTRRTTMRGKPQDSTVTMADQEEFPGGEALARLMLELARAGHKDAAVDAAIQARPDMDRAGAQNLLESVVGSQGGSSGSQGDGDGDGGGPAGEGDTRRGATEPTRLRMKEQTRKARAGTAPRKRPVHQASALRRRRPARRGAGATRRELHGRGRDAVDDPAEPHRAQLAFARAVDDTQRTDLRLRQRRSD